jgi:hypothetical protein
MRLAACVDRTAVGVFTSGIFIGARISNELPSGKYLSPEELPVCSFVLVNTFPLFSPFKSAFALKYKNTREENHSPVAFIGLVSKKHTSVFIRFRRTEIIYLHIKCLLVHLDEGIGRLGKANSKSSQVSIDSLWLLGLTKNITLENGTK